MRENRVGTDDIWHIIDRERVDLADFLEGLTPEQWATPSLCDGWTVRDVAVHLTQSAASWSRLMVEVVRSGFRFNHMVARAAREDTSTPEEIVATLRAMVGVRRRPPGTVVADPLMDTLVHGQDIAVPLGLKREMPVDAALIAAQRLWKMKFPFYAGRRFAGVELVADDADFRVGSGERVAGSISDIVLALSGRKAGLDGLSGPLPATERP
jgi:uncharacterized protein (TIGR03083 family)